MEINRGLGNGLPLIDRNLGREIAKKYYDFLIELCKYFSHLISYHHHTLRGEI